MLKWAVYIAGSDRHSVVGIVTRYRLDGPGFERQSGRDYPDSLRPAPRRAKPPV
jgi:hypothetical protein